MVTAANFTWHGAVMAYTRRGYDWANRFKSIAEAAKTLPVREAVIDGEVIVATPGGLSDFGALQEDLGTERSERMTYYAFDLLYVDGYDLRGSPLLARKGALQRVLEGAGGRFLYSQHLTDDGPTVQARACTMGIEGVVSKRADSVYRSGRNEAWIKLFAASGRHLPLSA